MSTKRIYKVSYQVIWKANGKGDVPTGHDHAFVFSSDGVEEAVTKLRAAKSKQREVEDEDGKKITYTVGKIEITSCELVAESDIG